MNGLSGEDHVRNNLLVTSETCRYAAFFSRLTFAHLARWNAAIFLQAATDLVRLGFTVWLATRSGYLCPPRLLPQAGRYMLLPDENYD